MSVRHGALKPLGAGLSPIAGGKSSGTSALASQKRIEELEEQVSSSASSRVDFVGGCWLSSVTVVFTAAHASQCVFVCSL